MLIIAGEIFRVKEPAEKWGISPRRLNQLLARDYFPGAYKQGKFRMIPSDAGRPNVLREKKGTADYIAKAREKKFLPCPVGITSYKEASGECCYADQTLMIKDIIDDHNKVYLFTRPRRFGKTLAMDMVRTFFEKTGEDTSVYFRNRKIWSAGEKYRSMQGRFWSLKRTWMKPVLKKLAEEGLRQILDRQYYAETEYHGIRHIVMFGIAFSGRKVSVQVGERGERKESRKEKL